MKTESTFSQREAQRQRDVAAWKNRHKGDHQAGIVARLLAAAAVAVTACFLINLFKS